MLRRAVVRGAAGTGARLLPVGSVGGALLAGVVALGAGEFAQESSGCASFAAGAVFGGCEAFLALGHGEFLFLVGVVVVVTCRFCRGVLGRCQGFPRGPLLRAVGVAKVLGGRPAPNGWGARGMGG